MADLSITIENSMSLFGGSPSNKWYEHEWGTFLWGEGTADMPFSVGKLITNQQALSDSFSNGVNKSLSNSLSFVPTTEQALGDGSGYTYRVTPPTSWASQSIDSTWTEVAAPSTDWSEA